MPLQQLNKYLLNRPQIVPSATMLAKKYNMETTSVSRILKRLGYIHDGEHWYLPSQETLQFQISNEMVEKLMRSEHGVFFKRLKKEIADPENLDLQSILLCCIGMILHNTSERPIKL